MLNVPSIFLYSTATLKALWMEILPVGILRPEKPRVTELPNLFFSSDQQIIDPSGWLILITELFLLHICRFLRNKLWRRILKMCSSSSSSFPSLSPHFLLPLLSKSRTILEVSRHFFFFPNCMLRISIFSIITRTWKKEGNDFNDSSKKIGEPISPRLLSYIDSFLAIW